MSYSNSNIKNFLNNTRDKISSFISDALYSPPNNIYQINSSISKPFSKSYSIDLYRSDYIPLKKNINNSQLNYERNEYSNLLGLKTSRSNNSINQIKRINIPNDKRYHKSLLESSLDQIRNEIRQKKEENIIRMNELNNKKDKLNDFFLNENNNKGKFTSIFSDNNINNKDDNSINLDENVNNSFLKNENLIIKNNLKREFNTEFICSDINESFSINAKNKKKKSDENTIQKQTEFAFNININKANIEPKNDINDNKALFKAPKDIAITQPISSDFSFGFNQEQKDEEMKSKNKNKKQEENKEQKVLFGAPKEPTLSEPLSSVVSFGIKKETKDENKESKKNKLFETPKKEKENKTLFGAPKRNKELSPPLSNVFTFGVKKEKKRRREQNRIK